MCQSKSTSEESNIWFTRNSLKVLHTSRFRSTPANLEVSSTGGPVKATSTETVEDVDVEPEGIPLPAGTNCESVIFRTFPFWGGIGFHRFPSRSLEGSQQWGEVICPERLRSTGTTKCHGSSWMFRRSEMDDVRSYCWWCALSTGSRKTT